MENTNAFLKRTIGEIVADDYRAATVFEKHGVDFCCGGQVTLSDTCLEKGLDPARIIDEIEAVQKTPVERGRNYGSWSLSFLADYIVNTHHTYLRENIGEIVAYTQKIAKVHGEHHPEVVEIAAIFAKIENDMLAHLRAEEEVCFPAIKRVEEAQKAGMSPSVEDIETIRHSLLNFHLEHEEIGDAAHKIRHLAKGFALPDDACNTFMITYQKLQEFEDDLHKHVHLENNILFPKVTGM
ncbi:MAG: iron-sulfur cluster repair protein ScdA [Desulfobulbaceae bacterium BRH_c16a]|nr:MAG: iron-sulfur cluster repair protein ScdA [Desulfobulbaceae bacterium BRH_c16a]